MKELTLEEIQKNSFLILKKLKEMFEKNNWRYYLAYGTLIGAVRHNNFIPWDDDIDIWVPRDDYEKFVDYCQKNKDALKPFELIEYRTNSSYIYPIGRFNDSRYCTEYKDTLNYGLGLFVDIYPLDGILNDKKLLKQLKFKRNLLMLSSYTHYIKSNKRLKNFFRYFIYLYSKKINRIKLIKDIDILSQKYNFNDSQYFNNVTWEWNGSISFSKDDIIQPKYLLFNGEYFSVPYNYDGILKSLYGDYMKLPPEEDRFPHHFYTAYLK